MGRKNEGEEEHTQGEEDEHMLVPQDSAGDPVHKADEDEDVAQL
jgi:hypothetical protein